MDEFRTRYERRLGVDRLLGYGLKYDTHFKDTHSACEAARPELPMKTLRLLIGVLAITTLGACGKKEHTGEKHGQHAHVAPHGGTLVELGDHTYNLELVRNNEAGKLSAYVLDGHAEKFVRINSPAIELIAMPGGTFTRVSLKAVANSATGETVGDTSQFEAQADWLKTAGEFAGIVTVEIRGVKFEKVEYALPK